MELRSADDERSGGRRRNATVCQLRISGSAAISIAHLAGQGQRDDLFAIGAV